MTRTVFDGAHLRRHLEESLVDAPHFGTERRVLDLIDWSDARCKDVIDPLTTTLPNGAVYLASSACHDHQALTSVK